MVNYSPPNQGEIVTGLRDYYAREAAEDAGRANARNAAGMGFSLPFPTLALTLSPATRGEDDPTLTATFTATISKPVGIDTPVALAWSGTASRPADVVVPAGPVIIPAGQTSVAIPVTVVNDSAVESNETLILTVSAALGGVALTVTGGGALSRTLTITSEDA